MSFSATPPAMPTPCLCKNEVAALTDPSFLAALNANASAAAAMPPLPPLPDLAPPSLSETEGSPGSGSGAASASLMVALQGLHIPAIPLLPALPKLTGLVAAAMTCRAQLGIPMPEGAASLSAMLQTVNPAALSPLMALDLNALGSLQARAAATLSLRAALGANPWDADLSAALSARLSAALNAPAMHVSASVAPPALPAGLSGPSGTANQVIQVSNLASLSASLGANVASPAGIAHFMGSLQGLAAVSLPQVAVPPGLLERLFALDTINAAFGLNASAGAAGMSHLPSQLASLNALLSVTPPMPSLAVTAGAAGPPMPTPAQLASALAADLPHLAAVNPQLNGSASLLTSLPALSLAARVQAIVPAIKLSPCSGGCPAQAASAMAGNAVSSALPRF